LLEPDMGSIRIDGQETTDLSERARNALLLKTGALFQRNALFESLTAWENVAFGLIACADGDKTTKPASPNVVEKDKPLRPRPRRRKAVRRSA
jgi:ABC-type transporter Mla maintaining outer membrane lipid asymmetry ATPase subunit MlaF